MSESDRRSKMRVSCFADAELDGLDVSRRLQVRIADLSTTGAFVDVRSVLPSGTKTMLKFTLEGRSISTPVEVCYSMPSFGMGVRFLELTPEDSAFVERFVAGLR
jgi:hypothetical protein